MAWRAASFAAAKVARGERHDPGGRVGSLASHKTQPECIDYYDQQLETPTSRAVLKKGPGHWHLRTLVTQQQCDSGLMGYTRRIRDS